MKLYIRAHDLGVKGIDRIACRAKQLGFSGVQLVAYKATENVPYEKGGITSEKAETIQGILSRHCLSVPLIGAYFNPVHSDAEKRNKGIDVFKDYIDVADIFDCEYVGSETGSYNDDKWTYNPENRTEAALKRVTEVFRELALYAEERGKRIAVEGAWGHVCSDVQRLYKLRESIGANKVGVVFDLFNYLSQENFRDRYKILDDGLKAFGKDIVVYHIKDFVAADGFRQVAVGKGILDYAEILGRINEVDPCARLVFEGTTGEDVPFALEYIKDKAKQVGVEIE